MRSQLEAIQHLALSEARVRLARQAPAACWFSPIRNARIEYGYVTGQMGTVFTGDPRDVAIGEALYMALESRPRQRVAPARIAS